MSASPADPVGAFLEIVERDRRERCRRALEDARARAAVVVRAARHDARTRVAAAVREDRALSRRRIEFARAELATRERQRDQQVAATLLERGWERVREALVDLWSDPATRASWIRTALAEALSVLPTMPWRITHPPRLDPSEVRAHEPRIAQAIGTPLELAPDELVLAGLRVSAGGATFDATLQGLLADRSAVEARLLVELARESTPAGDS